MQTKQLANDYPSPGSSTSASTTTSTAEKLCFDKNEFMKANFSVDEFLHNNRNAPSLELLRDNLGLYLKGLRSSMIDLINEDYADFVSLSANLVGLDQSISTIQRPLEEFHNEISGIRALIQENEAEIRDQLEKKRELRELKRDLQSLKKVYEASKKLEDLLSNKLSASLQPVDLERAALELIQLKFNEKFCKKYLKDEQQQQIIKLEADVLEKMRRLFTETLKAATITQNAEQLERSLRIYSTLDACHIAEEVFREDFVSPYMSTHISEQSLQSSPQGLAGVYSKILDFIALHMTDLLRLTQYTDKLRGFNFVVKSFWIEVAYRLETNMSSIFAPGNSDVFFAKYKCTRDFLGKVESLLPSQPAIKEFRHHKQTKSFLARWNLPVYFQICFQEIAGQFEGMLEPLVSADMLNTNTSKTDFRLVPLKGAEKALQRCWADGVFLGELFPKFYKMSVQIVLRLSRWIDDVIKYATSNKNTMPAAMNRITLLIALHVDICKFVDFLPQLQQAVATRVPPEQQASLTTINETLSKSFVNLQQVISDHTRSIQVALVELLISESGLENVRQVNDLPRLYRKTNREVPTRCSSYVEQLLRPLRNFAEQQQAHLGQDVVEEVLAQVFNRITTDYFIAVTDVLTSVQKTEESLRRLRNLKAGNTSTTTAGNAMSDDDKIRMQLRVDVAAWTNELSKLNFMPTQIDRLFELNNIVEESMRVKEY